jgi:hypothetical protein
LTENRKRHDPIVDGFAVPEKLRILEADGLRWRVHEVPAPEFDRRRGGSHLLFHADTVMRRVRTFPSNWFQLPDVELYALTDQARKSD